jgi:HlyD family secretion protein
MKSVKVKAIIGIASTLIVVALVILIIQSLGSREEKMIRSGQIEMREYDLASKLPGRVEWIKVDEGDLVNIGQELFKLTDKEIKAKVAQAQGAVSSASAQLNMVREGSRTEQIDMAEKKYLADKSQFELAEKTFRRMNNLHIEKLISDQEFDVVEQKYKAAQAAMQASKSQFDMAKTGARRQEKQMAAGQLERASQTLEEAKVYYDETILRSPWGGIVSKRYVDAGELVATGYPILSIIDTTDSWAELNLPANELERVKIGMVIKGTIHGLGCIEDFKVTSFSAMADYANWRTTQDKAVFDVRTFTVKLTPVRKTIPSLRPGMTVTFDLTNLK